MLCFHPRLVFPSSFRSNNLVHHSRKVHEGNEHRVQRHEHDHGRHVPNVDFLFRDPEAYPNDVKPDHYGEEEEKYRGIYYRARVNAQVRYKRSVHLRHAYRAQQVVHKIAAVKEENARCHDNAEQFDCKGNRIDETPEIAVLRVEKHVRVLAPVEYLATQPPQPLAEELAPRVRNVGPHNCVGRQANHVACRLQVQSDFHVFGDVVFVEAADFLQCCGRIDGHRTWRYNQPVQLRERSMPEAERHVILDFLYFLHEVLRFFHANQSRDCTHLLVVEQPHHPLERIAGGISVGIDARDYFALGFRQREIQGAGFALVARMAHYFERRKPFFELQKLLLGRVGARVVHYHDLQFSRVFERENAFHALFYGFRAVVARDDYAGRREFVGKLLLALFPELEQVNYCDVYEQEIGGEENRSEE